MTKHSKIKTKPWNIKINIFNISYSLNNMITVISGGDFFVNISAGYIDTPVCGKTIMALWASNCYYSSILVVIKYSLTTKAHLLCSSIMLPQIPVWNQFWEFCQTLPAKSLSDGAAKQQLSQLPKAYWMQPMSESLN